MAIKIVRRRLSKPQKRVVRRRTERRFIPVFEDWKDDIRSLSYNAYVPQWNHEDVAAEMYYCLWIAFKKFNPHSGKDFGKFWWSIWLNRRAERIRYLNAKKRSAAEEILTELSDSSLVYEQNPLYPIDFPEWSTNQSECKVDSDIQRLAWVMLGMGWPPEEVKQILRIHYTKWDAMLESWRTDSVRLLLTYCGDG